MSDEQSPPRETAPLDPSKVPPSMPLRQASPKPDAPRTPPWRLLVQVSGSSHATIGLEIKATILIGRADPQAGIQPDLDLTPYGGETQGVSRRHAHILEVDGVLYVEDLKSTNHTYLNSYILQPQQRYRLRDGDELTLGKLRLVVRFVKSPSTVSTAS